MRTMIRTFMWLTLLLSTISFAQEVEVLEEIVVTGSRIPRNTLVTPSPVTVLSAEDIEISGAVNIGDLLNQLPALGSTRGSQNSDRFIGTAGLNMLDLRRLGTSRTLVLVNGQRHVAGSIGTAAVDINSIPAALIERVEVVTGGASAVYGADAVTGVINFIMKDNFQGTQIEIQTGSSHDGLERSSLDIVSGFNFADNRGNAVIAFEYSKTGDITAADRGIPPVRLVDNPLDGDSVDADGNVINDGIPDEILVQYAGLDFINRGGLADINGVSYFFDAPGSFRPQNFGTDFGGGECGGGCDFLDLTDFVNLSTPQERYAMTAMLDYRIVDDHVMSFEGKFVNSQASGRGQPHFNFGNLFIAADNPYLAPELATIMLDNDIEDFGLNRFNVDAGLRGQLNERQTTRVRFGLSGPLSKRVNYEVNAIYGRTTSSQLSTFNRINERFYAAADAVRDADGNIVCRSSLDIESINTSLARPVMAGIVGDCVPVNLFGDGAVSQEAIDYFSTVAVRHAEIDQAVFNATVNGLLFTLPAGTVDFAAGVESREETSNDQPDSLNQLGLTFGNALQAESGRYNVSEVFGEVRLPLLNNVFLARDLSLDLAARFSDYSTIGNTFTYKAGLEWAPIESVRFRGTFSDADRAPNIGELFGPQNQNFFNVLDPCSEDRLDLGTNGRSVREENCRALGIPVGFDSEDQSSRDGLSGGNPGLEEESSESFTVGVVWEATDDLWFAIDYWDISIDNAISSASAQAILDRCVDAVGGIDNAFCGLIDRDEDYNISLITQTLQNIAGMEASGIDLEIRYGTELAGGDLGVKLITTWLEKNDAFPFQEDPSSRERSQGVIGDPEYSSQLDISWQNDRYSGNWSVRYIDTMLLMDREDFEVNPDARDFLYTGNVVYHDLYASVQLGDGLSVSLGIDNVLDEDVPAYSTGTGGSTGIFDNIGRFYYGAMRYSF